MLQRRGQQNQNENHAHTRHIGPDPAKRPNISVSDGKHQTGSHKTWEPARTEQQNCDKWLNNLTLPESRITLHHFQGCPKRRWTMPASRNHRVSSSSLQTTRQRLHAQSTGQRLLNEGFGWMYDPFVTGICARKRRMGALEAQQLS